MLQTANKMTTRWTFINVCVTSVQIRIEYSPHVSQVSASFFPFFIFIIFYPHVNSNKNKINLHISKIINRKITQIITFNIFYLIIKKQKPKRDAYFISYTRKII